MNHQTLHLSLSLNQLDSFFNIICTKLREIKNCYSEDFFVSQQAQWLLDHFPRSALLNESKISHEQSSKIFKELKLCDSCPSPDQFSFISYSIDFLHSCWRICGDIPGIKKVNFFKLNWLSDPQILEQIKTLQYIKETIQESLCVIDPPFGVDSVSDVFDRWHESFYTPDDVSRILTCQNATQLNNLFQCMGLSSLVQQNVDKPISHAIPRVQKNLNDIDLNHIKDVYDTLKTILGIRKILGITDNFLKNIKKYKVIVKKIHLFFILQLEYMFFSREYLEKNEQYPEFVVTFFNLGQEPEKQTECIDCIIKCINARTKCREANNLPVVWDSFNEREFSPIKARPNCSFEDSIQDIMKPSEEIPIRIVMHDLTEHRLAYCGFLLTSDPIRKILSDYCSFWKLLFHWRRHHTQEVRTFLSEHKTYTPISIHAVNGLLTKLKYKTSFNQNGSFARRMKFLNAQHWPTGNEKISSSFHSALQANA